MISLPLGASPKYRLRSTCIPVLLVVRSAQALGDQCPGHQQVVTNMETSNLRDAVNSHHPSPIAEAILQATAQLGASRLKNPSWSSRRALRHRRSMWIAEYLCSLISRAIPSIEDTVVVGRVNGVHIEKASSFRRRASRHPRPAARANGILDFAVEKSWPLSRWDLAETAGAWGSRDTQSSEDDALVGPGGDCNVPEERLVCSNLVQGPRGQVSVPRTFLGEQVVLFRGANGQPAALEGALAAIARRRCRSGRWRAIACTVS